MPWERGIRESGLFSMVAGALVIATVLLTEWVHEDLFFLVGLALLFFFLAVPGLRAAHAGRDGRAGGRDGRAGQVGAWVSAVGAAVMVVLLAVVGLALLLTDFDPEDSGFAFAILVAGFLLVVVGNLLFGFAIAKASDALRWAGVLLAISLPLGILIDIIGSAVGAPEIGFWIGVPAFAVALLWLGYAAWTREASRERVA